MPGLSYLNCFITLVVGCGMLMPAHAQRAPIEVSLHYGHPDISLECVTLDDDQLVYMASNYGFYVFDGRNIKEINWLQKSRTVSSMRVAGDSLIIGYQNGTLTIASVGKKTLLRTDSIVNVSIGQIEVSPSGNITLGTAGRGIHLLATDNSRDSVVSELSDSYINDLYFDPENLQLTAATDRGTDRLNLNDTDGELEYMGTVQAEHDIIQSVIRDVQPRSSDLLAWGHSSKFGTIAGEKWISGNVEIPVPVDRGHLLNALGHAWLMINNSTIYRLSGNASTGWSAHAVYTIASQKILAIKGVREGYLMVWLKNGQLFLIPATYNHFSHTENISLSGVSAVSPASGGGVWVAHGDTLLELSLKSGSVEVLQNIALRSGQDFPIISLAEQQNHMLAGSFGDGLFMVHFDENDRISKLGATSGLENGSILDIASGRDETWISTMSGVHKVALTPDHTLENLPGAPGYVYCLEAAPNGNLYVGSQGESMFVNRNNELVPVVANDTSSHSIISIEQDATGRIWGLTTGSELFHYGENEVIPHALNDQLKKLGAYRVFMSPLGHLGLISDNALYNITPKGVAYELLGGPDLFKSDFQNISTVDSDKNLWLARPDGLVVVEEHAMVSFHFPNTNVQSFRVDGEEQSLNEAGNFSHSIRDLSFELKSVWHDPYRPVVREYRLMGLDTTWRTIVDSELHFARLSPGNYDLEIRTLFGPTMNPVHHTAYAFKINTPVYFQWWFIALVMIVLGTLLLLAVRYRERRMASALALKTERIQTQFEVLKNQINPHFLFNSFNTLASLIPDDPKKAERFTEKLSAYFREILSTQDKETNSLERELELAEDFIFLQQSRYGENLQYFTDIDPTRLLCALPTMALQILLENAVKHNQISQSSPLRIEVKTEGVKLIVMNNLQLKSVPPESTGLGLSNLSNRLQILVGKSIEVEQSDDTFKVTIPLLKCD